MLKYSIAKYISHQEKEEVKLNKFRDLARHLHLAAVDY